MTLFDLALKNIKGNKSSYRTYFLATTFSVMIFFLFAVLIYHPDIEYNSLRCQIHNAGITVNVIIFSFLFFFISHAILSYAKKRSRDFAIVRILGATPSQIFKAQFVENITIFIGAVLSGIVLGLILEKLFFSIFNLALDMKVLNFYFPSKAILLTTFSFSMLFLVLNIGTSLLLNRSKLSSILVFGRKSEKQVKPNYFWTAVGVSMMFMGYYLAYTSNDGNLRERLPNVVMLVVSGSLMFYWHSVNGIINLLRKRKKFFYKGVNILWISDLGNRAKSLTWVMFFSTTVIATGLTAIGTVYSVANAKKENLKTNSYELTIKTKNNLDFDIVKKAKEALTANNAECTIDSISYFSQSGVEFINKDNLLVSNLLSKMERAKIQSKKNPIVIYPEFYNIVSKKRNDILKNGMEIDGIYFADFDSTIIELAELKNYQVVIALDNNLFNQKNREKDITKLYIFNYDNFQYASLALMDLQNEYYERDHNDFWGSGFYCPGADYRRFTIQTRFALVLSLFVGLVFFISSGSMLYFNFYNNLEKEREKYEGISLIGLSKNEIIKSTRIQMAILFFLPNIIAILHTLFALKALDNTSPINMAFSILTVVSVMFVIQVIYFLVINKQYNKHLLETINWI